MSLMDVLPLPDHLAPEDVRFCRACLAYRPLTEFRLRKRGGIARFHQCNACHLKANGEWRVERRNRAKRRKTGKALTVWATQRNHERMTLAFAAILKEFGGLEGFVTAWRDTYDHAPEGTYTRFRCLEPMINVMMLQNSKPPQPEEEFDQLTDEQFTEALNARVEAKILNNPALALWAAEKLGWTVIPPQEDEYEDL